MHGEYGPSRQHYGVVGDDAVPVHHGHSAGEDLRTLTGEGEGEGGGEGE